MRPPGVSSRRGARSGPRGPDRAALAADLLGVLAGGLAHLLAVALRAVLKGRLRRLRRLARDLLAVLQSLLAGLLGLLGDLVGDLAELLVLHARGGDEQAGDEADRDRADREAQRVLLGQALRAAGVRRHLPAVRRRVADAAADAAGGSGHGVLGPDDFVPDGLGGSHDLLLGPALDVGLVLERVDGLAHLRAGLLYLLADPVWVFAHWMSSFTVSTVWGAGGVACCSDFWPALNSANATIAHRTVTISAASHVGMASSSAAISVAVRAPSIASPKTAAAASRPAPLPATLPFCVTSACASLISWRTSVEVCPASSLTSSPTPRSRMSWPPAAMVRAASRARPARRAGRLR